MKIGYARTSTLEQKLDMQIDALQKVGCEKIFTDKMSGMKDDRPGLKEMLEFIREGDEIHVFKLDRISRSTKSLLELAEIFEKKKVHFISIHDKIDTSSPHGKFFFTIMSAIAQLERDITVNRVNEGLKAARSRGKIFGRPKVQGDKLEKAIGMYKLNKYSIKEITDATGVAKSTLYKYLQNQKLGKEDAYYENV